ncbi:MAG: hypothetical protein LUG65_05610 [Clostridiales bacterium]|nr:hypothetical protein [Clostridiales bacterium]
MCAVSWRFPFEIRYMPQFNALWEHINSKSVYVVDFDANELVEAAIDALNRNLRVSKVFFKVESGQMEEIKSREDLLSGTSFVKESSSVHNAKTKIAVNRGVKYDLVGKLVEETGLTRKDVIAILTGINKVVFSQFRDNPEEFIIKAAALINGEKASAIIKHITYNMLDDRYDKKILTTPSIKGKLGVNAMKVKHHLYDHLVYDSNTERDFAKELDAHTSVVDIYVKLPHGFYNSTPVGHYTPDWAIAFKEETVKHIYFVAETKGSTDPEQWRDIEKAKIHCAREHFKAISSGNVVYDVVDSYDSLRPKIQ